MPNIGIRLQLLIGPTKPVPAPFELMSALDNIEVRKGSQGRDGFQLTLGISKDKKRDYWLLKQDYLQPKSRVIIIVTIGSRRETLMDGIITNHQVAISSEPGQSRLVVTGEDISLLMDLDDENLTHPNQSDSTIVKKIIDQYANYGFEGDVENTDIVPNIDQRISTQQMTDLAFLQSLAARNGFVFYTEPKTEAGKVRVYWGSEDRKSAKQPAITVNMGPYTNVASSINISFNALGPVKTKAASLNLSNNSIQPVVGVSGPQPLSQNPAGALRTVIDRSSANLSYDQARLRVKSSDISSEDAVTATGDLDSIRYGQILKVGTRVDLRGVGVDFDGAYDVKQVTHKIKAGEFAQSFTLTREGKGSQDKKVSQ